jgi:NTP pyrophosphatase (non-canonical NTP hydrolase)
MANLTELQKQVAEYDSRYGWGGDKASHITLHMSEELGEISRRVLRFEGYKIEGFDCGELAGELTDLLYLTLKLANKFDIDLEGEWDSMWDRYEEKTSRK